MTSRPLLAEVFVRLLYVVVLLASFWILLRGHNSPGGGFIGGLIAVAASAAYALIFSSKQASQRMPLRAPVQLAALGVLIALVSGIPALLAGLPFLTHIWFNLPLGFTDLPLSTVQLFDIGVYLCVWGSLGGYCLALIHAIEETA